MRKQRIITDGYGRVGLPTFQQIQKTEEKREGEVRERTGDKIDISLYLRDLPLPTSP